MSEQNISCNLKYCVCLLFLLNFAGMEKFILNPYDAFSQNEN